MCNTELLWGGGDLTSAVSVFPIVVVGRWGAQPWKPPLHYPGSFQFGFELQLTWWGLGARGEWSVGRLDRKDPGPSAHTPTEPRPSLKAEWELGAPTPRILASRINPHFLAQTLTSCTYPMGSF